MATGPGIFSPALGFSDQLSTQLHDGMVAWWDLEEASGTRFSRIRPNSAGFETADLGDINGVANDVGIPAGGNAGLFIAVSAQELIADNSDLASFGDHDFTVAGWVFFSSLGVGNGIVAKWEGGGADEWILYQDSVNFRFYVTDDGSTANFVTDGTTLSAGTWYFVVGWYDKTRQTINIQVNNGTVYSVSHTLGVVTAIGTTLRIGSNPEGGTWHDGLIDSVGLWDRVLTTTEKTLLYNGGNGYVFDRLSWQLREQGQNVKTLGINGLGHPLVGNYIGDYFLERTTPLNRLVNPANFKEQRTGPIVRVPISGPELISQDLSQVWFELVHLFPKSVNFGQVLTTVTANIELFNGFRNSDIPLNTVVNPLGAGIGFNPALPGLPTSILHLESLHLVLEANQNGSPIFKGIIDFGLSLYTLHLPIEGLRVVVFPYAPEVPVVETLKFLTDILPKQNGLEQRINLRKSPRQSFDMHVVRETSVERSRIENLLFEWQARAFGIPIWFEPTELTANVLLGDSTINVGSTYYADYRVGGIAIILQDDLTFDALTIQSVAPRSITFASGTLNAYNAGVRVYPMRICLTQDVVQGSRMQNDVGDFFFTFIAQDNANLGSTAAFSTFNGKVLLDDPNFIPENQVQRNFNREIFVRDGNTGKFSNVTPWAKTKHLSFKGWAISGNRQKLWEVRQLIHALRGKQTSFYIPTFQNELVPTQPLTAGASGLQITHVGYTRYVQNRSPKNIIRLTFADGSKLIRTILTSTEASPVENLVLDSTWPSNVPVANISKIEMLELVRLDSDDIRIEHASGVGDATLVVPVISVFD